jgi:SAM-dependent methyltransferase
MDEITKEQTKIYQDMWKERSYRERSPGMRFLSQSLDAIKPAKDKKIIDLGCGTGRVCAELRRLGYQDVTGLDIAYNACTEFVGPFIESCLWEWESAQEFDLALCFDVMEHIPTERVEQTIASIYKNCRAAYFQVANFVCHEGDKFGYHLHPTVKPLQWWADQFQAAGFTLKIKQANPKHHIIYVTR